MAGGFDDREDGPIHAPRLFLFTVSIAITTLVALALVGSFDPIGIRYVVGGRAEPSRGHDSLWPNDVPDGPSIIPAVESPVDPFDVTSVEPTVSLVRSTVFSLDVPERNVQAAIDALARQITEDSSLARSLIAVVEGHAANHRAYVAEAVLAALGRTDAGLTALVDLLRRDVLTPRLRGAIYLALVQGVRAAPDLTGAPRAEAYARSPLRRPPDAVVAVFHESFQRLAQGKDVASVERERFLAAGASSGAFDSTEIATLLDARDDVLARQQFVSALARGRDVEYVTPPLRRAWLFDPDRTVRRIAVGALVRFGRTLLGEVAAFAVDDGRPGADRIDALHALSLKMSLADDEVGAAELAVAALINWASSNPELRDDEPTPDMQSTPAATPVVVSGRERVRGIAKAFERAAGSRSRQFAAAAALWAPADDR